MSRPLALSEEFPKRRSEHRGSWAPLYLEPLVGSGERICIGVLAQDNETSTVVPVRDLERLTCVYGDSARSFAWAAELALAEIEQRAAQDGLQSLADWTHGIDGLVIGAPRLGAGTALDDLAQVALRQVSSLTSSLSVSSDRPLVNEVDLLPTAEGALDEYKAFGLSRAPRLDMQVRRLVITRRPQLHGSFGKIYRASQSSRPLKFGYVGKHLVANFSTLAAGSTNTASSQVDRAKARLWDLQQLKSGTLADSLKLRPRSITYELLVHRPPFQRTVHMSKILKEAEEELEAEADKFHIRFHPMKSPQHIANFLIEREAA